MTTAEQIILVINTLCEKFGIAIDWTAENVAPYIEALGTKLVAYGVWSSIATIAVCVVMSILSVALVRRLHPVFKNGMENSRYHEDDWGIGMCLMYAALVILNLVCIIMVICNVYNIVKCLTFPELYVFEYVQNLITTN